ncbi:MAG: hypothetical protein H6581_29075 [Bacteroidia bacterium]|nr:hypothetical protein [Bacteroidia bacterium]
MKNFIFLACLLFPFLSFSQNLSGKANFKKKFANATFEIVNTGEKVGLKIERPGKRDRYIWPGDSYLKVNRIFGKPNHVGGEWTTKKCATWYCGTMSWQLIGYQISYLPYGIGFDLRQGRKNPTRGLQDQKVNNVFYLPTLSISKYPYGG